MAAVTQASVSETQVWDTIGDKSSSSGDLEHRGSRIFDFRICYSMALCNTHHSTFYTCSARCRHGFCSSICIR